MLLKGDWARRRRSSELAKKFASSKFEGDLPYWMGVLEGIIAPFAWHDINFELTIRSDPMGPNRSKSLGTALINRVSIG